MRPCIAIIIRLRLKQIRIWTLAREQGQNCCLVIEKWQFLWSTRSDIPRTFLWLTLGLRNFLQSIAKKNGRRKDRTSDFRWCQIDKIQNRFRFLWFVCEFPFNICSPIRCWQQHHDSIFKYNKVQNAIDRGRIQHPGKYRKGGRKNNGRFFEWFRCWWRQSNMHDDKDQNAGILFGHWWYENFTGESLLTAQQRRYQSKLRPYTCLVLVFSLVSMETLRYR